MKHSEKRRQAYHDYRLSVENLLKNDSEKLYKFRCVGGRLLQSILNYEFWADEKDILNSIVTFKMVLLSYYELLSIVSIKPPKLSKMCKNVSYIKGLINNV